MLKKEEIKVGEICAWDISVGRPDIGCNVFKIVEIYNMNDNIICVIESIDGCKVKSVSPDCLITKERALRRLSVLESFGGKDNIAYCYRFSYIQELGNLKRFKEALKHIKNNT